jgi:hypothetical protein
MLIIGSLAFNAVGISAEVTSAISALGFVPATDDNAPLIHPFLDGDAGTIPGRDVAARLADIDAPVVVIERFEPTSPRTGDELKIYLSGKSPLGIGIQMEYREDSAPDWQSITEGSITLPVLREGNMTTHFRSVDAKGRMSKVLTKSWRITPGETPELHIAAVSPDKPFVGDTLKISLASNMPDDQMVFEWRRANDQSWQQSKKGMIEVAPLSRGRLDLEFRCTGRTQQVSDVVSRSWDIMSRCDVPLDISADVDPDEPVIGGGLTIRLSTRRSSSRLAFQYRIAPDPTWMNSAEAIVTVENLKQGEFIAQFRIADGQCNDTKTSGYYRIDIQKHRFEVTGLLKDDRGRLLAKILDHTTGKTNDVGVSDSLGNYSVAGIVLAQGNVIIREPDQEYVRLPIPRPYVEEFRQQRLTTPRTTARSATNRGKSERYIRGGSP